MGKGIILNTFFKKIPISKIELGIEKLVRMSYQEHTFQIWHVLLW